MMAEIRHDARGERVPERCRRSRRDRNLPGCARRPSTFNPTIGAPSFGQVHDLDDLAGVGFRERSAEHREVCAKANTCRPSTGPWPARPPSPGDSILHPKSMQRWDSLSTSSNVPDRTGARSARAQACRRRDGASGALRRRRLGGASSRQRLVRIHIGDWGLGSGAGTTGVNPNPSPKSLRLWLPVISPSPSGTSRPML